MNGALRWLAAPERAAARALALCSLLATVPFWVSDLDIRVAGLFFFPDDPNGPWPLATAEPWRLLYEVAGPLAALLGLGSLAVLAMSSRWSEAKEIRRSALVVLLGLALGPGLIVNVVFKGHWGRPRPNQLAVFSGHWDYLPPGAKGTAGKGESFPCGHASVGFAYGSLWVVGRRRHPRAAALALAASLALGTLLGVSRMAAGHHFLSDVLWSGILTLSAALMVLRLVNLAPLAGQQSKAGRRVFDRGAPALYAAVGVAILGTVLLATPMYKEIRWQSPPELAAAAFDLVIEVDRSDVDIELVERAVPPVRVFGTIQGFGLPGGTVHRRGEVVDGNPPTIRYRVRSSGWFTDLDGHIALKVASRDLRRLEARVGRGSIRITPTTAISRTPELDVVTGEGTVVVADASADR